MRHFPSLLLLAATLASPAAQAQTRVLSQINGWSAFSSTGPDGIPLCGLETRDPRTGRHFLLRQPAGQDRPQLQLSRTSWNLGTSARRPVRIVIDNRRSFSATAVGAGRNLTLPLTLEGPNGFEAAFRRGMVMRVEFPSGQDASWDLSLTGTNAVMGAFMGCLQGMGDAPVPLAPPASAPAPEPSPAGIPGWPSDKTVPVSPPPVLGDKPADL